MPNPNKPDNGGSNKPAKSDVILGTEGSDGGLFDFFGTSGDDTIDALGGDDIIVATLGNDSIDGGDGTGDTLIYDLLFPADDTDGDGIADFSVSRIEKGKNVTYEVSYTVDGVTQTDTVKNVEYIIFSDGTVLDTVNNVLDPGNPPPPPPPAPGTITFDAETPINFASTNGTLYDAYQSPDGYIITQQTSATNGYEDVGALADYDPSDADFEFRVFTDADGTTHEMAVIGSALGETFSVTSVDLSGLEAGDVVEVYSYGFFGPSSVILSVTDGDISNGVLDLTTLAGFDSTDILQFSVVAVTADTEFYVDDLAIA
ncbi:hypothetical protein [Oceanibium sediminis]|uniref:hypothetical protein n=1 Tax=Oceanibium sediminis TaxID=2026339 RepID=UPI000DD48BB6|nr:hypothetical protein [Oceanibium sediminis]